jgi:riboflavin synthase alpha subunit
LTSFELLFSLGVLLALAAIGFCWPALGSVLFRKAGRLLTRLAGRPFLSLLTVAGCSLLVNLIFAAARGLPVPAVHDEFSYLLAADTFAHGRLSNPAHPLWTHFESMHIIQQPTYASKYPPVPGLFLAAGQVVTGLPIAGAWLASALACAALTWMVRAWLRPNWALLAGLAATIHPLIINWSQSYWGGSVAFLGGALLLGSWKRLTVNINVSLGLTAGSGMALLANSRPYEGAVLSLLCMVSLMPAWISGKLLCCRRAAGLLLGLGVVLVAYLLAMLYYNKQVTGDPWKMPYTVHAETYDAAPVFLFQSPKQEPVYRHAVLRDFHLDFEARGFLEQRDLHGFLAATITKFHYLLGAYFHFVPFLLALAVLPWMVHRNWWNPADLAILALFALALLPEVWMQTHYTAPITALCFALLWQALRRVHAWRPRGRAVGRFVFRWSFCLAVAIFALQCVQASRNPRTGWQYQRAGMVRELEQAGGKHLVLVRYAPGHNSHQEWVYNDADIDASPVVWAREMEPADNQALLGYFHDRQIWLLEADATPPALVPYKTKSERRDVISFLSRRASGPMEGSMFTGLVEGLGTVRSVRPDGQSRDLVIAVPDQGSELALGDSLAINGCCLTVVERDGDNCRFQAGPETLSRTNLGELAAGDRVNLERALRLGDRLGGHLVQGHIDGVGRVADRRRQGDWELVWFSCPAELAAQMVPKGSVAVDGVSLTLVEVGGDRFSVALIPHTLTCTTLGFKSVGNTVNLETDLLAKYVWKCLRSGGVTLDTLRQAGFLA